MRRHLCRLHGRAGLLLGLLALPLMLSGLLLHHPDWLGGGGDRVLSLAMDPADPRRILRGGDHGLQFSEDGGKSWRELPLLVEAEGVVGLAFTPDAPERAYAVLRDQGLIRAMNGSWIWEPVELGFHPAAVGVRLEGIAAGAQGRLLLRCNRGILSSRDAGESWTWMEGANKPSAMECLRAFHAGHTGPGWLAGLWEVTGWGLLLLIASGVLLLWRSLSP